MAVKEATPRRVQPRGAYVALVKPNYKTIAQARADRERDENFDRGCRWAALVLGGSFGLMLAIGMMLGWS